MYIYFFGTRTAASPCSTVGFTRRHLVRIVNFERLVFEDSDEEEEEQVDEPVVAYYDPRRLIWGDQAAAQKPAGDAPIPGTLTTGEYGASISNLGRDRTV